MLMTADCFFNLGMVFKKLNRTVKARQQLIKCMQIRKQLIGSNSMEVADVLEQLGVLSISDDTRLSYNFLNECFNIR